MRPIKNLAEINSLRRRLILSSQPLLRSSGNALTDTLNEITRLQKVIENMQQACNGSGMCYIQARLSPQMLEVIMGAAKGETAIETAERLGVAEDTIKTHRRRAYERLGVKTMAEAVYLCAYQGLINRSMMEDI